MTEVTDGSCVSHNSVADGQQAQRAGPPGKKAPATVGQLAASVAGVHSEHTALYFILLWFGKVYFKHVCGGKSNIIG